MRISELREYLTGRIHADDIVRLSREAEGERGYNMKAMLYSLALGNDRRAASNALWVFTHLNAADRKWLRPRMAEMADRAMSVTDTTCRRLLLTLLERQDFGPDDIRGDFLDFCLEHMLMDAEPVGIRSLCVKIAYKMCRHYPELLSEFRQFLTMMPADVSPGLRSCCRNILRKSGE